MATIREVEQRKDRTYIRYDDGSETEVPGDAEQFAQWRDEQLARVTPDVIAAAQIQAKLKTDPELKDLAALAGKVATLDVVAAVESPVDAKPAFEGGK